MSDVSIVIPTYNEAENIERLVEGISKLGLDAEIVIVDDSSPDGTGEIAEELKKRYKNLQVLHRKTEKGLASAVVKGFKAAHSSVIGVMDADFSHPPKVIPEFLEPLQSGKADLAIGSRYVTGGGIVGWNLLRKLTSRGAILLARPLTPIKDSVSGFFFLKREAIEGLNLNPKGYKIGLEVIVKGRYKKAVEIPYIFVNRKEGKSKLSLTEYMNYIVHLLKLYSYKLGEIIKG